MLGPFSYSATGVASRLRRSEGFFVTRNLFNLEQCSLNRAP